MSPNPSNEQTVKDLYAAFGRADMPAILALVADDVDWRNDAVESRECPWNGNFSGKAKLPGFFQALADNLDLPVFDVKAVFGSGAMVAAVIDVEGTVKRTGRTFRNEGVHIWTFNPQGKVAKYRHYNDTAAERDAWRG